MSERDRHLENARRCFQQAALAQDIAAARECANLGMAYLQIAQDAADVADGGDRPKGFISIHP